MAPLFGTSPRRALGVIICVAALAGCKSPNRAPVYVVTGNGPNERAEFRPVSSYAEYLVFPGARSELRITLASYAASCDAFVAPGDADSSITVTVISPAIAELGPGTYAWAGHEAHGGTAAQPERAYALPTVRLGHRGSVLPAGGELQLESVATTQDGRVRGRLDFEFAGDAEHPATSLKGGFEAKLCRVRL